MRLTQEQFREWLERYFRAWQSNDPDEVTALFSEDAVYYYGPFQTPSVGRRKIVERWISSPEQQTEIQYTCAPLAIHENLGVAHWHVLYRSGKDLSAAIEMDGVLVLKFDDQLRCTEHREWYARREVSQAAVSDE